MSEPIQTAEELNRMLTLEVYGLKPPVAPKGFELGGWIVCGNKSEAWILQPDGHVLPASSIESYLHRLELRRVPEPPKPRTRELWLNIYASANGDSLTLASYHESRRLADNAAVSSRIACQRIVLTEGQFDSEPSVPGLVKYQFECEEGQTPVVLVPTGEVRPVERGEMYRLSDGSVLISDYDTDKSYPILRRIEPSRV